MEMNNLPLICILGKSGSGKSTLVNFLENSTNMKQIPSYTTRPPRYENEKGHTFVTKEEFNKLTNIVAYNYYLGNEYGVTEEQIDNLKYKWYVVDVTGFKDLKRNYKGDRPIIGIYIQCTPIVLYDRLYNRYMRMYNDPVKATQKTKERVTKDEEEFKDAVDIVDYVIDNNDDIESAIEQINIQLYNRYIQYIFEQS